jgi:hypothetical protein
VSNGTSVDPAVALADDMIDLLAGAGMPEIEAYRLVSDALSRQDDATRYDGPSASPEGAGGAR